MVLSTRDHLNFDVAAYINTTIWIDYTLLTVGYRLLILKMLEITYPFLLGQCRHWRYLKTRVIDLSSTKSIYVLMSDCDACLRFIR